MSYIFKGLCYCIITRYEHFGVVEVEVGIIQAEESH